MTGITWLLLKDCLSYSVFSNESFYFNHKNKSISKFLLSFHSLLRSQLLVSCLFPYCLKWVCHLQHHRCAPGKGKGKDRKQNLVSLGFTPFSWGPVHSNFQLLILPIGQTMPSGSFGLKKRLGKKN